MNLILRVYTIKHPEVKDLVVPGLHGSTLLLIHTSMNVLGQLTHLHLGVVTEHLTFSSIPPF